MEALPMDIIKLIANVYYTPKITFEENYYTFILIIEYPTNTISLSIPPLDFTLDYDNNRKRIYSTQKIENFIAHLKTNEDTSLLFESNELFIYACHPDLCIKRDSPYMEVSIKLTPEVRQQLAECMMRYLDWFEKYLDRVAN